MSNGESGDDLFSTFSTPILQQPSNRMVHFAIWVDASGAATQKPINNWQFWPQLAALLALIDTQLEGRVKQSLTIEHAYTKFHLGRDALRSLAAHFQHVEPLAFRAAVPYVDLERENVWGTSLPKENSLGAREPQWRGNLQPFELQFRHEWNVLSTALLVPVTHLEIERLNAIYGSPRIVLPRLVPLTILASSEIGELFRRLDAGTLTDLHIMLDSPMFSDVVSALLRRSHRAIQSAQDLRIQR